MGRGRPALEDAAPTKAPEGTGGRTASRLAPAPNKSGVVTLRPRPSLAGLAAVEPGSPGPPLAPPPGPPGRPPTPAPGPAPWITPRSGLAVRTCPFGQDEMYRRGGIGHNGLIHEVA